MAAVNREQWLTQASEKIREHAETVGIRIPKNVRVSIGFPSTRALGSKSGRVVGQCFHPPASADGTFEIFISPVHDSASDILSTLTHELTHAAISPARGHKSAFQKAAADLDLVGPWPAAGFAGGVLPAWARAIAEELGPIPHAKLDPASLPKKQTTRMVKLQCSCGYIVRTTAMWISRGVPSCYCGDVFVVIDAPAYIPVGPVGQPVPRGSYSPAPVATVPAYQVPVPEGVKGQWILTDILENVRVMNTTKPGREEVTEEFIPDSEIPKDGAPLSTSGYERDNPRRPRA